MDSYQTIKTIQKKIPDENLLKIQMNKLLTVYINKQNQSIFFNQQQIFSDIIIKNMASKIIHSQNHIYEPVLMRNKQKFVHCSPMNHWASFVQTNNQTNDIVDINDRYLRMSNFTIKSLNSKQTNDIILLSKQNQIKLLNEKMFEYDYQSDNSSNSIKIITQVDQSITSNIILSDRPYKYDKSVNYLTKNRINQKYLIKSHKILLSPIQNPQQQYSSCKQFKLNLNKTTKIEIQQCKSIQLSNFYDQVDGISIDQIKLQYNSLIQDNKIFFTTQARNSKNQIINQVLSYDHQYNLVQRICMVPYQCSKLKILNQNILLAYGQKQLFTLIDKRMNRQVTQVQHKIANHQTENNIKFMDFQNKNTINQCLQTGSITFLTNISNVISEFDIRKFNQQSKRILTINDNEQIHNFQIIKTQKAKYYGLTKSSCQSFKNITIKQYNQ